MVNYRRQVMVNYRRFPDSGYGELSQRPPSGYGELSQAPFLLWPADGSPIQDMANYRRKQVCSEAR
jgi:hypothetical protein